MKNIRKMFWLLCITLTISNLSMQVYATESMILSVNEGDLCTIEEAGTYSTDIIEYKYRIFDGKLQYRRWNSTKGYWIDATWLDA